MTVPMDGLEEPRIPQSLVYVVTLQARNLMCGRDASLEKIARAIGLSPRTLQRQLIERGTSFRTLIAEIRFNLACDWLSDNDMTIEAISYELGYSDPSNFTRALHTA